uniref:Ovule protein n=1 Tax=Ascaris lumbricoides TaxID=6252 RepID=A0A0M3HSE3_ASCLU
MLKKQWGYCKFWDFEVVIGKQISSPEKMVRMRKEDIVKRRWGGREGGGVEKYHTLVMALSFTPFIVVLSCSDFCSGRT